ncbi:MAG: hypothetical protein HKN09_13450 [Saprospiraceae bacterium]|nr:hypothetical protein [Saprospiraceae bacterium]
MGDKPNIYKNEGFLNVPLTGTYSKDKFLDAIDKVASSCTNTEINKAIIDGSAITNPGIPALDRFQIGEYMAINLVGLKVAIIWPKAFIKKFGVQVATNRGANVNSFSNEKEALHWLHEEQ